MGTTMEKFSFEQAFKFCIKAPGWKSFAWKYILAYGLVTFTIYAIFTALTFSSTFGAFTDPAAIEADPEAFAEEILSGMIWVLAFVPVYLIGWLALTSVFEAAALRFYIRQEKFSLRFGRDELRVAMVLLIWVGCGFLLWLVMAGSIFAVLAPMVLDPASVETGDFPFQILLIFPLMFILCFVFAFFGVRFGPASAITIRDNEIKFFKAWKTTKGRFWSLVGAYFIIGLIMYGVLFAVQILTMPFMMMSMFKNMDDILRGTDPQAAMMASMGTMYFVMMGVQMFLSTFGTAFMHYACCGITSKAALTDPNWSEYGVETAKAFE